jgi:hypothetical protein
MKAIIELLSAALTPVIALITVYIAYQQYQTNRYKLRLDMYDKRFKVFLALREFISHILENADVSNEVIFKFNIATSESVFLFDKEIPNYLQDIRQAAINFRKQNIRLNSSNLPVGEERNKLAQENSDLLNWLSNQFTTSEEKFAKYLRLKV